MLLPLVIFNAMSFVSYGVGCLLSRRMRGEFIRYGLSRFRLLVGVLQITGAFGLIAGFWSAWVGVSSAFGLATLMLLGVCVRIVIKDTWLQTLPAAIYMLLNSILVYLFFQLV